MTGCPLLDSEYAARQNGKRLPCERLAEENAKLRETLSILWFCQQYATDCDDCKINDGDGKILEPCAECACDSLCDRIRELGVEV